MQSAEASVRARLSPDQHDADLERELIGDMAALSHDPLGFVRYAYPWGVKGTELEKYPNGPRSGMPSTWPTPTRSGATVPMPRLTSRRPGRRRR